MSSTLLAENKVVPLLGASLLELTEWVQQQQQPTYRAKQLHQWIYERGVRNLAEISVFPKQWRSTLGDVEIGRSTLYHRAPAPDGTVKYLLKLTDGQIIETVGIPTFKEGAGERRSKGSGGQGSRNVGQQKHATIPSTHPPIDPSASPNLDRLTVCVSSQVGCPMACDFCATGKGGFRRNLARHEIVDQVLTVQEDFGQRVSNIVLMGMGEPLLNLENVLAAIHCLNQDIGIGQRNITLSTVGIPNHIRRLAQHHLQITLAVSLHASNQALREKLIPSARQYPITALLDECREYVQITGRRVTFEYIVLAGLNDQLEHAIELAEHLRGFQSHVNLIPYNPISEVDYQRPTQRQLQAFVNALKERHIAVSIRRSRGLEADAACGQLRASQLKDEG
jgi:23S rRNA (adenine2503-C2)-methyltransferase